MWYRSEWRNTMSKGKYRIFSSGGIDEKLYVNINGHNQYVFIRGKDINNPIILNLHGGPANPDAFLTYEFAQAITYEFTYVSWDQRGCGRTYYKNKHIDPKNESTDFGQAIKDVDELAMAYKSLQERFSLENLIKFQRLTLPCFVGNMPDLKQTNQIKLILSSPDLAFDDIRWLVGMLNLKAHYVRNKKLLDYTLSANIYDIGNEYSVPMYFVSGEYDKTCRVDLLKKYYDSVTAPNKKLVIMKACGHSPQIDDPVMLAKELKNYFKIRLI